MTILTTFTNFGFFFVLFLLHWIEKWSSRGRVMEHLDSSDTKIMMRGPIVCQLGVERNRETNKERKSLKMNLNFIFFPHRDVFKNIFVFFALQVHTLVKFSRHAWSLIG